MHRLLRPAHPRFRVRKPSGTVVSCWTVKAATAVQIPQHRLSTHLVGLRSSDPRSRAAVRIRQPLLVCHDSPLLGTGRWLDF
jgi:hypothetical protein